MVQHISVASSADNENSYLLFARLRPDVHKYLRPSNQKACLPTQAMMRLLYVAIGLGAVSCITESVLKFVVVRSTPLRASAVRFGCSDWCSTACHAMQVPNFDEATAKVAGETLERAGTIICAVNCVRLIARRSQSSAVLWRPAPNHSL